MFPDIETEFFTGKNLSLKKAAYDILFSWQTEL